MVDDEGMQIPVERSKDFAQAWQCRSVVELPPREESDRLDEEASLIEGLCFVEVSISSRAPPVAARCQRRGMHHQRVEVPDLSLIHI